MAAGHGNSSKTGGKGRLVRRRGWIRLAVGGGMLAGCTLGHRSKKAKKNRTVLRDEADGSAGAWCALPVTARLTRVMGGAQPAQSAAGEEGCGTRRRGQ